MDFVQTMNTINKHVLLFIVALTSAFVSNVYGQSEIGEANIFGYFQSTFDHNDAKSGRSSQPSNSFYLQQANLMVSREFIPNLDAFVNLEMTNNYSSSKNFGSFSLQEAWVKYRSSDELSIKAGLLIPVFNNLNTIKNRTPLLPYIFRPFVYEASIADIFPLTEFVPEHAFFQAEGFLSIGDTKLDYAAYIGNGDEDYSNSSGTNFFSRGIDTTLFKMVGGRVGVRGDHFKAGISMTSDKDNGVSLGLGPVQRYRVGGDLSFDYSGLSVEFEVIALAHPMTPEQEESLASISNMVPELGSSLDKNFFYGLLNYDINDQFFGYIGYNYLKERSFKSLDQGLEAYTIGGGFRPHDNVVIKAQYILFKLRDNPLYSFREDHYMIAVSVFF
jgi:hypothetical protein